MLNVFVDTTKMNFRFSKIPGDTLNALSETAQDLDSELVDKAKGLASGAVLQIKTGKYVSGIKGSVRTRKQGVYARVWNSDERADLFEFGGKTKPHEIDAKDAHALVLQVAGGKVFAKSVMHPGGDYGRESLGSGSRGKYSVIFASYDAMRAEIFSRMRDAGLGAIGD